MSAAERIRSCFKSGEKLTALDIDMRTSDIKYSTIGTTLAALAKRGELTRVGQGLYMSAKHTSSPPEPTTQKQRDERYSKMEEHREFARKRQRADKAFDGRPVKLSGPQYFAMKILHENDGRTTDEQLHRNRMDRSNIVMGSLMAKGLVTNTGWVSFDEGYGYQLTAAGTKHLEHMYEDLRLEQFNKRGPNRRIGT